MTNWAGHDVLYIGDHIYGDLAVSEDQLKMLNEAWTCPSGSVSQTRMANRCHSRRSRGEFTATVSLFLDTLASQDEINIINSDGFQKTIRWVTH
jgi:hypothetical protein